VVPSFNSKGFVFGFALFTRVPGIGIILYFENNLKQLEGSASGLKKTAASDCPTAEKELKILIGLEMKQIGLMTDLADKINSDPDYWVWAAAFVEKLKAIELDREKFLKESSFMRFKIAVFNIVELRKLKKELEDDYHTTILDIINALRPLTSRLFLSVVTLDPCFLSIVTCF